MTDYNKLEKELRDRYANATIAINNLGDIMQQTLPKLKVPSGKDNIKKYKEVYDRYRKYSFLHDKLNELKDKRRDYDLKKYEKIREKLLDKMKRNMNKLTREGARLSINLAKNVRKHSQNIDNKKMRKELNKIAEDIKSNAR